ncbi:hypothetical protein SE17_35510, partial [Kouleothrix aurantiaca]
MENLDVYIPQDRRIALSSGADLPRDTHGAALFADISGFTPLTEGLSRALGPRRGAEELTRQLNLVYDALVAEVDRYGGSVLGFSGDAITCWFGEAPDGAAAARALTCGAALQRALAAVGQVTTPGGLEVQLTLKVAVAAGTARRMLVGDPGVQQIELLAGQIMDRLAAGEQLAGPGEVLADAESLERAGRVAVPGEWRAS